MLKERSQHAISNLVSTKWLNENLDNEGLVVLDATIKKVSDAHSFSSEEWIPKTRYFDLKGKFSDSAAKFPTTIPSESQFQKESRNLGINTDSKIIIYDTKGIYSSARAWWLFKTFGFESVAVLDGGFPEWKRLGYKTVHETISEENMKSGNFIAQYKPKYMRYFDDILQLIDDRSCMIIDARSEPRFNGLEAEPREGLRSGNIPNSKNLPYTRLFDGHCLRTREDLNRIFNEYNINNKYLTFSCGSGITACILALGATVCDYGNLSVYDGSWTEYGTIKQ